MFGDNDDARFLSDLFRPVSSIFLYTYTDLRILTQLDLASL